MSRRSATTTKVFVGSLPEGATADDLRKLFEPYGAIAECDISNKCGFLHLEDRDLAMKAIEELNGVDFMGAKISVEKGRVKPRRGPGGGGPGPMRGGRDRGGPYFRPRDFRGPPQRNGFGDNRDMYNSGPGHFDRPSRGNFDGGFGGDRRPGGFDDRRGGPGFNDRRPFNNYDRGAYGEDRQGGFQDNQRFDDRRGPMMEYDDRRPMAGDRRNMLSDQHIPRGGPSFDRGAAAGDLFTRREGLKSMGGGGGGGYAGSSNGYGSSYGGATGASGYQGGYGDNRASYGTSAGGFGASNYTGSQGGGSYGSSQAGGYGGSQGGGYGGGGAQGSGGYGGAQAGSYGDTYGNSAARSYDAAYPPLPQQRNFGNGGGGGPGGPRRDMAPGRRF